MSGHGGSAARSVDEALPRWMSDQRWYAGKGHVPILRRVGGWRREDPDERVGIEVVLVAD